MKVVPENNWESYSYRSNGELVVVGFHVDANKIDQSGFPFCARVVIPIKQPNHNGGPAQSEAEVLWSMEDRLVEELQAHNVVCLLLGRLTHGGLRELVFQLSDWETFRPRVGKWMLKLTDRQIDVSEHRGWEFFFQFVWPSPEAWLFIADRRVVDNLVKSGSDPSKPHSLEFVFRGEAGGLEILRDQLLQRSYTLYEFKPAGRRLVMALSLPLDPNRIFGESLAHTKATKELGLEYDGWGCMIVK